MSAGNRRGRSGPKPVGQRIAGEPGDPRGFHALARAYLDYTEATGASESTYRNRRHALNYFIDYCAERGIHRPAEVTVAVLERYQHQLRHARRQTDGRPLSFRGQILRLTALKGFFAYLVRHRHILYSPAAELELPRAERRLPRYVLTAAEAERVLAQPNIATAVGLRDRAILELFYSSGLRRAEVIGLSVDDIDHDRGNVLVRQGKNRKDRLVPLGERALAWIERYLAEVRDELKRAPDAGTLFLTYAGEPLSGNRLSELTRGYVDAADLGKPGSCHLFRHTMATLMLEGGADIRYIQAMLGHAELSTTERYTQVSIARLKDVHRQSHPARLPGGPAEAPASSADPEAALFEALEREDEAGDEEAS